MSELIDEFKTIRDTKTVGLITGCFDLLHVGHINLFRFAKEHVEILVVGIDNDLSIQKTKGIIRPIITQNRRAEVLSELTSIDYVVLLDNPHEHKSTLANTYYDTLVNHLRPNYLVTNKTADKYWREKERRIKAVNGSLLLFDGSVEHSTTAILDKIKSSISEGKSEEMSYYVPL